MQYELEISLRSFVKVIKIKEWQTFLTTKMLPAITQQSTPGGAGKKLLWALFLEGGTNCFCPSPFLLFCVNTFLSAPFWYTVIKEPETRRDCW